MASMITRPTYGPWGLFSTSCSVAGTLFLHFVPQSGPGASRGQQRDEGEAIVIRHI